MKSTKFKKHITPININGLNGRVLRLPPPANKKREMLIIYGHHASIERMFGVAEDLNRYGGVTMPDLPGFGGMDSFYKIGQKPTLDNMADYLASFIKLKFRGQKITILAMSYGFIVVANMLQRYPHLVKKVNLLVSIVGFTHKQDLKFSKTVYSSLKFIAVVFSTRGAAWFGQHFILRGPFIRATYILVADKHSKLKDADKDERDRRINFEIDLWKINDMRTHAGTTLSILNLDLCQKKINLIVHDISVKEDRYLDPYRVEQHMRIVFNDYDRSLSPMEAHAPTVIADAQASAALFPAKIRRILAKNP